MSDLREARLALAALLEAAPGLPVCVSLTFERKQARLLHGHGRPAREALRALAAAGRGGGRRQLHPDQRRHAPTSPRGARTGSGAPLVLQPNAGAPELEDGQARYDQTPEEFAADLAARVVRRRGAVGGAVGGCCGTDPRFIAALARLGRRRAAMTPAVHRLDAAALPAAGGRAALPRLPRRARAASRGSRRSSTTCSGRGPPAWRRRAGSGRHCRPRSAAADRARADRGRRGWSSAW